MPVVMESVQFKNSYSDISAFCHKYQEPIIITENGKNDIAVMSMNTYEEITGIKKLLNLLETADSEIENGKFITEEEMDKKMDLL